VELQAEVAAVPRRIIAITGARGLVGSRLVRRLESDDICRRIVLLDIVPPKARPKKSVFYRVDLTEPLASTRIAEALRQERPTAIVHLAFLQHPTRDRGYAHELESLGTERLLHALTEHSRAVGSIPLVASSSTFAYGAAPDNPNFLREDDPLRGRLGDFFVGEKIHAERRLREHAEASGQPVTVLRFAPILDASGRTLAARYFRLSPVPTVLGYNPLLQLLGADDAAHAVWLALGDRRRHGHRVYNVAAGGVLPLLAAIRLAGRASVPMPALVAAPLLDALFQSGAAIAPGAQLDYLKYLFITDTARAASELGFRASASTRDLVLAFAAASVPNAA
jgi:UDP-glucose 4-epimerase